MVYFETNAMRKLAYKLLDENFVKDKYTSILSLIELMSGICDNESFLLRKSIISKVIQSKIWIDLDLPDVVFLKAFGSQLNNYEIGQSVGKILDLINVSDNYFTFQEQIESNTLKSYWEFICVYDKNAREKFKEAITNNSVRSDTKLLIPEFKSRWVPENLDSILSKVIYYYASKTQSYPFESRTLEEIINSYDHSINIYLFVSSYYIDQKVSSKNTPAKNDFLDLFHLIYLKNVDDKIVSDDKMLHQFMKILFPNNIVETKEM
jgi:hypothetical protein